MADINLTTEEEVVQILTVAEKGDPGEGQPIDATLAEAQAGTETARRSWSPLRVWDAIRAVFKQITAQAWTEVALGTVGASLEMDLSTGSDFSATLPLAGTTTSISFTGSPSGQRPYWILDLVTQATLDQPIWSGIDATAVGTLDPSTVYKIAIEPLRNTSGVKYVALIMHSEADA